ncbi:MAG TPA: hypothetical protein VMN39_10320 [Longimicrobiaceae bacterium]|nr:hypothetical protein [Longimicrobiaceae bacterium]
MVRTRITSARALLPLLGLLIAGCSPPDAAREAVAIRDSSGIRIVENGEPLLGEGSWSVSAEPLLQIGVADGDERQDLHRVAGAIVLSDGRVVVANLPAPMVRWYGADGAFLVGAGRPGGGPGEFGPGEGAWIHSLWALEGDSVGTWEHSSRRLQVFGPEGSFVRAVVLDLPPDMPPSTYPQIAGLSGAGFVAFLDPGAEMGALGEPMRDDWIYLRYRPDGSYAGRLASLPGPEMFTMEVEFPTRPEPFRTRGRPPFAKVPSTWVQAGRFYYGSGDRYEIAVYGLDGALVELVRKAVPNRPVTPAMREADQERRRAAASTRTEPKTRPAGDELPYPDSLPAFRQLRLDREGWLWVQDYGLPGEMLSSWSVFDPAGRWVTDLQLPTRWRILDIGPDYILALMRDEMDVESVHKFGLVRGPLLRDPQAVDLARAGSRVYGSNHGAP